MKAKILKTLALAFGLATASLGFAGDIYEIRPCDEFGAAKTYDLSLANPAGSGENLYFLIRLNNRYDTATSSYVPWKLNYKGLSSASTAVRPQIGIYVSGRPYFATMEQDPKAKSDAFTDLIFKYTTQPGDFALPIRLATSAGPADIKQGDGNEYAWYGLTTDNWSLTTGEGASAEEVTLSFGNPAQPVAAPDGARIADYTLEQAQFFVQTIFFDTKWESDDGSAWRYVHQDSNITSNYTPSVVLPAASTEARTLYVWSMNDEAVYVKGGTEKSMKHPDGETRLTKVGTLTIPGGATSVSFDSCGLDLWGVAEGESAQLVLSAFDEYYTSSADGTIVEDFITVPVKCVEPMPATVAVTVDPETARANSASHLNRAATLTVYLTQPLEQDIDVTITPDIAGQTLDMTKYVKMSTSATSVKTINALSDTVTVTLPKNTSGAANGVPVYVYTLRADEFTSGGSTIDFIPSVSAEDIAATGLSPDAFQVAALEVVADPTVIVAPSAGSEIGATSGVEKEIEIELADTYAHTQLVPGTDSGYTIQFKQNDASTWVDLAGEYYIGAGNVLRDADGKLPKIRYTTSSVGRTTGDTFNSSFRIIEPINNGKVEVSVLATVQAPKTVILGTDRKTYDEGDTGEFSIALNEPNDTGASLWAYVVAVNDGAKKGDFRAEGYDFVITSDMTDTEKAAATGLEIPADTTAVSGDVTFLDGGYNGSKFYFKVVLCTTANYDESAIVSGYNCEQTNVTVNNVEPTIARVELNNEPPDDTGTYPSTYPVGIEQTLTVKVNDPGQYDLTATEEADKFRVKWTVKRTGGAAYIQELTGNPDDMELKYAFPAAGTYTITVQVQDKDMRDWAELKSETYVVIIDQPQLTVTLPNEGVFFENEKRVQIKVGLGGYFASTEPIVVMVKVNSLAAAGAPNPGKFKLDSALLTAPAGYEAYAAADTYFLTFNSADALDVYVEEMDGTDDSSGKGFLIVASVLNDSVSTDPTKTWAEYYKTNNRAVAYVENAEPVVTAPEENGTNYWTTAKTISWSIKGTGDIPADFAGIAAFPGIRVQLTGDLTNPVDEYITEGKSYSVTPDFGTGTGRLDVYLTVTDKDGGEFTRVYSYNMPATKTLTTNATGPGSGNGKIPVSQTYAAADGLGAGHVYVLGTGVEPLAANSWTVDWNCKNLNTVNIYAYGYKVGAIEDGTLDAGRDIAMNPWGGLWTTGDWYTYVDGQNRDSFPYAWILAGGSSGGEEASYVAYVAPKYGADVAQISPFSLPTQTLEDGSGYPVSYVEAVFAREWRAGDNMGDINGDGVPDYFALAKAYKGGYLATADGLGSELPGINNLNDDADFYPIARLIGADKLVPNPTSQWSRVDIGQPFTTRLEIRGFHDGLNYGMFKVDAREASDGWVSDLDLSVPEKLALVRHAEATGGELAEALLGTYNADDVENWLTTDDQQEAAKRYIDSTWANYKAGDATTWGFTVENRTDPTVADTDGDGMADGYEYYFWYAATVGFDAAKGPVKGMRFTLNPATFETGVEIPSEEIALIFNPNVVIDWTKQDTDNDGLYDWEEMLIGTSPIFWDTDGDGTSDFYETYFNINPIAADNDSVNGNMNLDGDFMAKAKVGTKRDTGATIPIIDTGYFWLYTATDGTMWAFEDLLALDTTEESAQVTAVAFQVAPFNGGYIPTTENTRPNNLFRTRTVEVNTTVQPVGSTVDLYHHQVYRFWGFDPRTGWYRNNQGLVNGRWIKSGTAGTAVNTVDYTARDEFRLLEYRYIVGLRSYQADEADIAADKNTIAGIVASATTNPNTPFDGRVWGDYSDKPYGQAQHGADTDGDGVPDGWELYVGVNPNIKWTIPAGPGCDVLYRTSTTYNDGTPRPYLATTDADRDTYDSDKLSTLVAEYAGTDSCGCYEACDTIYANHPSKADGCMYRWYNKFFPTDPRDPDTDGDTVIDGEEGAKWTTGFVFNRWGQNGTKRTNHFTVYGLPHDNGGICIPGGGMSPTTIDTDEDGLPDGWEMQYAGILMNGESVAEGVFPAGAPDEDIYDDIRAALAAYSGKMAAIDEVATEDTESEEEDSEEQGEGDTLDTEEDDTGNAKNYYVIMGMDPTVADAGTKLIVGARDLDWDGDGLQNWQEYMVQAMRHFRYDDCRTPLMGCDIPGYDEAQGKIVRGEWLGEDGYLKMSFVEPYEEAQLDTIGDTLGYKNFAAYAKANPDMLRALGYFADPPRDWDKAKVKLGYKYLLPPTCYYDMPRETYEDFETWEDEFGYEHELFDLVGADGVVVTNDFVSYSEETGYSYTSVYSEYQDGKFYYYVQCEHPAHPEYGAEEWWEVVPRTVEVGLGIATQTCSTPYYVSTDPRLWDTDNDGMDDYWELYHGLNPLLGHYGQLADEDTGLLGGTVSDIIYDAYLYGSWTFTTTSVGYDGTIDPPIKHVSAWQNAWVGWNNVETPLFDPIKFPWMMGTYDCDADGDGFRNTEETILANITTPGTKHTDPTPLWMTDTTAGTNLVESLTHVQMVLTNKFGRIVRDGATGLPVMTDGVVTNEPIVLTKSPSYTALYYVNEQPVPDSRKWPSFMTQYVTAFEENEGYDTDSDFKSDGRETVKATEPMTDPIDFSDPARRQSMYFGGRDNPGIAINFRSVVRNSFGQDLFKQFTVEAWVRPAEITDEDQCVVSRAINYAGWDLVNSNAVIRSNFAIGVDAEGHAYAEFEDSTKRSVRITGGDLAVDEWTHVAATFDGAEFALYVNGKRVDIQATGLIPANGVMTTTQDPQYGSYLGFPYSTYYVGPAATIIGAKATGKAAFNAGLAAEATDWGEIASSFFKGSVDEVRVWDGARSQSQINSAWKVRLSTEQVKSMRETVFNQFKNGARRNDGTYRDILDPELIQHYTFSTLPGATEEANVQRIVPGFQANVLATVQSPTDGSVLENQVMVGWWRDILSNEELSDDAVYNNPWTVPWIQNTVNHLPRLAGTFSDSMYWSEQYAGYTPASFQNVDKFEIANAMNPYTLEQDDYTDSFLLMKLRRLAVSGGAANMLSRFRYDLTHEFTGTDDLVPVGYAFAKRLEETWDGQGPEDAWMVTSDGAVGLDADPEDTGIPVWARDAYPDAASYWYAVAKGLLPDGVLHPEFKNLVDDDADGMPDWWSNFYSVQGAASDDDDLDGLSNYTEYLLSDVFDLGVRFDPRKSHSVSKYESDYFFKIGQLYAGEIFTDHDMMEDFWEKILGTAYVSRYLWDAKTGISDNDEDGWTAFSECRYNEFVSGIQSKFISHQVNAGEVTDYPIPTVSATIRYNGTQRLSEADATSATATNTVVPLVVKAYRRGTTTQAKGALSDAQWTIYPGQAVERVQNLGIWSDRVVHGTLTPGNIDPNSVELEFSSFLGNDLYVWEIYEEDGVTLRGMTNGTYEEYLEWVDAYGVYGTTYYSASGFRPGRIKLQVGTSDWASFTDDFDITVTSDETTENGYICFQGTRVGTINLVTGEYALDLKNFEHSSLGGSTNGTTTIVNSLVRISYSAQVPTLQSQKLNLYLGRPDTGALREGSNDFVAFYDLDSDGELTPGEPFGYIRNVAVSWYKPSFELELTDYSPVTTRMNLWEGLADRKLAPVDAVSTDDPRFNVSTNLEHVLEAAVENDEKYLRYRVARWTVDGYPRNLAGFPAREVASGYVNMLDATCLTEREILANGDLDLDWDYFAEISGADAVDLLGIDVTNVTYLVVIGEEGTSSFERNSSTNDISAFSYVISRRFDATRAKAVPTNNALTMVGARPKFSWKISGESDWAKAFGSSYTAFSLRVLDSANNVVYSSGNMRMPACDRNGVYTFEPPIYADSELKPDESYTWQVSIKNSKFKSDSWSEKANLYVNTLQNSDEYGSIGVCAKYFGPDSVLSGGNIVVEAFTTPDFTGDPAGRHVIRANSGKAKAAAFDVEHEVNATIIGLPKGKYYVRAYIDSKKYGTQSTRQSWESWGYACPRENAVNEWIYSPTVVEIGSKRDAGDLVDVYIEDVDTNQNGLPDAWEMINNDGSLDTSVETIDGTISGVVINDALNGELTTAQGDGSEAAGLAAHALNAIKNAGIAVLALDVDPSGKSSYSAALVGVESDTEAESSGKITSIAFVDGKLVITADVDSTVTTTTGGSSGPESTIWTTSGSSGSVTVNAKVLYKNNLSEADWKDTGVYVTLTVSEDGTQSTGDMDLSEFLESKGNPAQMFFSIAVEK
ncbi:MAG: LamG domain-containing protein [Lentisphaerae bacterium]|jgi:hypothetical protein|nr:LamG domain-containing protein [Lentisphaerota bacterium]